MKSRERGYWIAALAVVVAIGAGLGLAGALAESLRARGLLGVGFALGFFLVLASVGVSAVRARPDAATLSLGVGIVAVYGMVIVRMGVPLEERTHLFEYGLLAHLLHRAARARRREGGSFPSPALFAVGATAVLGWIDEGVQALLPDRVYDLRDVGFNALAGLMTVVASVVLSRSAEAVRRRKAARHR